jgi:hypothetical protein
MNRKQEINGKPEKEANKDLQYKVTAEHSRVFVLQAYTQTR